MKKGIYKKRKKVSAYGGVWVFVWLAFALVMCIVCFIIDLL